MMASISTEIFRGSAFEPTANLECLPLSPKILTNKSDAPFMIFGWSVKLSLQFTKPPSFKKESSLSQSPSIDVLRAAIILMQQVSAAFIPSSSEISTPTFPL